jgi:hypothetical protein
VLAPQQPSRLPTKPGTASSPHGPAASSAAVGAPAAQLHARQALAAVVAAAAGAAGSSAAHSSNGNIAAANGSPVVPASSTSAHQQVWWMLSVLLWLGAWVHLATAHALRIACMPATVQSMQAVRVDQFTLLHHAAGAPGCQRDGAALQPVLQPHPACSAPTWLVASGWRQLTNAYKPITVYDTHCQ